MMENWKKLDMKYWDISWSAISSTSWSTASGSQKLSVGYIAGTEYVTRIKILLNESYTLYHPILKIRFTTDSASGRSSKYSVAIITTEERAPNNVSSLVNEYEVFYPTDDNGNEFSESATPGGTAINYNIEVPYNLEPEQEYYIYFVDTQHRTYYGTNGNSFEESYTPSYINRYEVSFDRQNNSHTSTTSLYTNGDTYGTMPKPTKLGYQFEGWYTAITGGILINSTTTVNLTSDQTLYARYVANTLTVNYYSNYATSAYASALNPVSIDKNVLIGQWTVTADYDKFPANLHNYCEINGSSTSMRLDKIGYTGTGYWILNSPDSGLFVQQDADFDSYSDMCEQLGVSNTEANVSINVYAEWQANRYYLYFNANGGVNKQGGNFAF